MPKPLAPIPLGEIVTARGRLAGLAHRTPLLPLEVDGVELYLKLENLQPIGSFKLRGAGNALAVAPPSSLRHGVVTASAGNMALGVAWVARRRGLRCAVVVPDHAPAAKLEPLRRLGAQIVAVPFDDWWQLLRGERQLELAGHFVHPVCDRAVIAGNATIGLEIVEDLPDVDAVVVPFGGGGLSCGIASALRARRPQARVFAAEVETAAPLAPSLAAGEPRAVPYTPSFVDGIGGKSLLPPMWPLVEQLLAGSILVSLPAVAAAIRTLASQSHVVAEGAGAAALAAALTGQAGDGKVACVISGGNLEPSVLARILEGWDGSGA